MLLQEKIANTKKAGRVSMTYVHDILPNEYFDLKGMLIQLRNNPEAVFQEKLDGYNMSFYIQLTTDKFLHTDPGDFYSANSVAKKPTDLKFSPDDYGELEMFSLPHRIFSQAKNNINIKALNVDEQNDVYARFVVQAESLVGTIPNATYYDFKPENSLVVFGAAIEYYKYVKSKKGLDNIEIVNKIVLDINEISDIVFNGRTSIENELGTIYSPNSVNISDETTKMALINFIANSINLKGDYFSITSSQKKKILPYLEAFHMIGTGKDEESTVRNEIMDFMLEDDDDEFFDLTPFKNKQTPEFEGNYPSATQLIQYCSGSFALIKTCIAWRLYLFMKEVEYGEQKLKNAKSVFSSLVGQIEGQIVKVKSGENQYMLKVINSLYKNRQEYVWGLVDNVNKYRRTFNLVLSNAKGGIYSDAVQSAAAQFVSMFDGSNDQKFIDDETIDDVLAIRNDCCMVYAQYENKKIVGMTVDESYNIEDHIGNARKEVATSLALDMKNVSKEVAANIKRARIEKANSYIKNTVNLFNQIAERTSTIQEAKQKTLPKYGIFCGRFQGGLSIGHSTMIDLMIEDMNSGIIDKVVVSPQMSVSSTGRTTTHPFSYIYNVKRIIEQLGGKFELRAWMFDKYKNKKAVESYLVAKIGIELGKLSNKPIVCDNGVIVTQVQNRGITGKIEQSDLEEYRRKIGNVVPVFYFGDAEYLEEAKSEGAKQGTVESFFGAEGDERIALQTEGGVSYVIFMDRNDVSEYIASKYGKAPKGYEFSGTSLRKAIESGDYKSYGSMSKKPMSKKEFELMKKQLGYFKTAVNIAGKPNAKTITPKMANKILGSVDKFDDEGFEDYIRQMVLESIE